MVVIFLIFIMVFLTMLQNNLSILNYDNQFGNERYIILICMCPLYTHNISPNNVTLQYPLPLIRCSMQTQAPSLFPMP